MKYMIMMFGDQATMVDTRSTEWIKGMIRFMTDLDQELADSGELAASEGLADPTQATTVRFDHGTPVPTDGPFAEAKESLAGYWIVDVESPDRAYQLAAEASAAPGPGGVPFNMPIEVRQVMSGPPEQK